MNETPETIADIAREIREAAKASIDSGIATCDADERSVGEELLDYADRIDAALNLSEKPTGCGNAPALREALSSIERMNLEREEDCCELSRIVDAALSAPARNCDRFATARDATQAFQAMRKHAVLADACMWKDRSEIGAFIEWLFAPAEGGAK